MIRELKEVEHSGKPGDPAYLRFSNMPIARTESYADGEVNVDLDDYNEVVGIEMLSGEPEEWAALAEIAKRYSLSFNLFLHGAKK
jgi:uncharacterized protein YuzE